MTYKTTFQRIPKIAALVTALAFTSMLSITSCSKGTGSKQRTGAAGDNTTTAATNPAAGKKAEVQRTLTSVVTVADIRSQNGSSALEVIFNENAEFFTVTDKNAIAVLKESFSANTPVEITFDPWQGVLVSAKAPSAQQTAVVNARAKINGIDGIRKIDFSKMSDDVVNEPAALTVLNTTDPGLNNLIPDFATAQMMFDYIAHQCCALPGPYALDHCITFQYCQDGCYARAHKMCWIINNRYKYGTKKIFSFANSGSDRLCVQGGKWGGCCIRWWYHVAPLVTVQTPTGPKAYVFDPAMFNQPVLLATWLHAQENPACAAGYNPHVTMINVQPTTAYTPSGSSGLLFSTDPMYSSTNSTLVSYQYLETCP